MKLFGAFGDLAGWSAREVEAATLGEIKAAVANGNTRLAERLDHASTLVILNATIIPFRLRTDAAPISETDEIAFGPPVSGG